VKPEASGTTLVKKVVQSIHHRIESRELVPGSKLPSIRSTADKLGISKSTVVNAYERLEAEGVIRSRPGSGFRVSGHIAPLSLAAIGPDLERAIDPLWVSRQSLESGPDIPRPGCGWLPASWMPVDLLQRALRGMARSDEAALTDYSTPLGHPPLRQFLSQRLAGSGIEATSEQILLTNSGTQAIELLCRYLVAPGDTVLVDDPCYFNFIALLRAHQAHVVSVPYTPNGPDVETFGKVVAAHHPRLYITNSAVHNPTGAALSPIVAHRILKLAEEHDLTIVEDDIYAEFESEPSPRLAAFGGLERVVQIGSFSKSISGSARCGFIAARRSWIHELADLHIATSFGGCRFTQGLIHAVLKDGGYRKHLERLRQRLSVARHEAVDRLGSIGIVPWVVPRDGMFLWCRLPHGLDAADLAKHALEAGIVLAPGNVFSLSHAYRDLMRFNVAQMSDPRVYRFLAKACKRGHSAMDKN